MYVYLSQLKPRSSTVACDMVRLAVVIAKLECGSDGLSSSSNEAAAMKSLWGRRASRAAVSCSRARSSEAFCERGHGER